MAAAWVACKVVPLLSLNACASNNNSSCATASGYSESFFAGRSRYHRKILGLFMSCTNKMPASPARTYARELCQRPQLRLHWRTRVGELMLQKSQGWLADPAYFNECDIRWIKMHPGCILVEARHSPYPPDERLLQKWCDLYYPALSSTLWPSLADPSCLGCIDLQAMD